jgi:hypothetical protein
MSATLQLSRPSSLVDLVWPYAIVLDGKTVGRVSNNAETSLDLAPGAHTLQIRSRHIVLGRLGFSSPVLSSRRAKERPRPSAATRETSGKSPTD